VPNLITVQLIERGGVVHCIWTTDLRGGRMLGCAKLCSLIIRSKLYTIVSAEYQIFSLKHLIFTVSQRKEKEVDIIVAATGTKAFGYSRDGDTLIQIPSDIAYFPKKSTALSQCL
jgi:hypothetical protein